MEVAASRGPGGSGGVRRWRMLEGTEVMISGQMFYHKDTKKSLADTIKFLTKLHQLENIKYVLVHPDSLDKEIITNNPKIKPKRV
jgi:methyl coenzyme M reductase subunit D